MGLGFFVGVHLDEPSGTGNGTLGGFQYFNCPAKYGVFLRPNELNAGDFPELDLDDEI
jgi:tubulin-folding cofactor B